MTSPIFIELAEVPNQKNKSSGSGKKSSEDCFQGEFHNALEDMLIEYEKLSDEAENCEGVI